MKVFELYREVLKMLEAGGCESPAFDATCLLEDLGGIGRGNFPVKINDGVSPETEVLIKGAAQKRANGEPLQYLLGSWDFLNLTLKVGKGVLIPRPETELLCQVVVEVLQAKKRSAPAKVWDLCAGSGCVGLGIASLYPYCEVLSLEMSSEAIHYLEANANAYPHLRVKLRQANVLKDFTNFSGPVDVIVSNPPYIPTKDLDGLQREVLHEPTLALDGGGDGYRFYRTIADRWIDKLASNGLVAVEVGIGQAQTVATLFKNAGLTNVQIFKDYSGIDRVVLGYKI